MNTIEKVKEIMGFGSNFHMCDVSEITEEYVHLESWNEDVKKDDFDMIVKLIAYSARTAHPFQRNGAPFRFKLSKAQQVD